MALSMFTGGGLDPFSSFFNDPFFGGLGTDITGFGMPMLGDITAPPRRRRRGRSTLAGLGAGDPDVDVGHWHFDYYLSEPVQLELEEHTDKYIARLFHPGVKKEKLKLDIDNDTLIVSGEYEPEQEREEQGREEKGAEKGEQKGAETTGAGAGAGTTGAGTTGAGTRGTRISPRRQYKRFIRYMVLPPDVDQESIEAKHEDECLVVNMKKKQGTQPRTQRIPIK